MTKILCSASDAGGANAIVPAVKKMLAEKVDLLCLIDNQARAVFCEAGIDFVDAQTILPADLYRLIEKFEPGLFLAGTSLGKTLDKDILLWIKERGLLSVYVLDFWSNYWQRFSNEKKDFEYLPDYVCVMDNIAKEDMIGQGFPSEKIIVTGNPHFDHFTDGIRLNRERTNQVLFVSQPLRELVERATIEKYGYDEYQVLADLLLALSAAPTKFQMVIRLHPREDRHKFDFLLDQAGSRARLDDCADVKESLSTADMIVGMNSMVLFQAAAAGKPVISYQPGLRRDDPLISNRLGLSELFTDIDAMNKRFKEYFYGASFPESAAVKKNNIIKQATQNVIRFLVTLAEPKK